MKKLALLAVLMTSTATAGLCAAGPAMREPLVGGYSDASVTNAEVVAAANFAIKAQAERMRKADPSATLTLVKIVSVRQQVVAGMNYRLHLKVKSGDVGREAEAVVWWQAWNRQEPYKLTSWTWK